MAPHKRTAGKLRPEKQDSKRPRLKHGRQELRHITRTARRDGKNDDHHEERVEEQSESSDEEPPTVSESKDNAADGKAYSALLTLLKADHKDENPKKSLSSNIDIDAVNDDDIAGANIDEESGAESEDEDEDDYDDEEDVNLDPFEAHFNLVDADLVTKKAKAITAKEKWINKPSTTIANTSYTCHEQISPGESMKELPSPSTNKLGEYNYIKRRVGEAYLKHFPDELKPVDKQLFDHIMSYKDINFAYQNYRNTNYRRLYAMHALNHAFKTRDRILKNNEKLKHFNEAVKEGKLPADAEEPELRDQGFTRPKVLILLPTRNAAYEVVELLIKLSGCEQQENKKRFKEQFYQPGGPPETKPADFREMFKGNSNDFFSIGIKLTRKSLKLYSAFYSSDILIASPIGLSMILEDPRQSKRQYDFLSSIEVLIMDRANQIEMQNWDHVHTVMKYVNQIPKEFHGADFSRIRMWAIDDQARFLRQTMVFTEFLTPYVNNVTTKAVNIGGRARFKAEITSKSCIMNSIGLKIKQIFQRYESVDPRTNYETRYKFFVNSMLPSIEKQTSYDTGLLIYIPSYFDYVRVTQHMKTNTKFNFAAIDEYSSRSKVSRARHAFQTGKVKMLLYTERMHHFRRFELAGVKNVVIYEPPANPLFYKELLRFVGKSIFNEEADVDLSFVKTIFSKWDAAPLERIVGNERAPILCNSVNETYEFR